MIVCGTHIGQCDLPIFDMYNLSVRRTEAEGPHSIRNEIVKPQYRNFSRIIHFQDLKSDESAFNKQRGDNR